LVSIWSFFMEIWYNSSDASNKIKDQEKVWDSETARR
jgi:hypothetical protein